MDRFTQDRHWPWHQQVIVFDIALMLTLVGGALVFIAALSYARRDTRTSAARP